MSAVLETRHQLLDAFLAGDVDGMAAALAPDVVFHSPVTDYHGRDRVVPILRALTQIVAHVKPTSALNEPDQYVAFFTGTIQGHETDGVLRVTAAPQQPATELTLMIRPLAALVAGVERMKEALDSDH